MSTFSSHQNSFYQCNNNNYVYMYVTSWMHKQFMQWLTDIWLYLGQIHLPIPILDWKQITETPQLNSTDFSLRLWISIVSYHYYFMSLLLPYEGVFGLCSDEKGGISKIQILEKYFLFWTYFSHGKFSSMISVPVTSSNLDPSFSLPHSVV